MFRENSPYFKEASLILWGGEELHGSSTDSQQQCVTNVIRQWMLIAYGQGRN